jgi:hypothetical protein
MDCRFLNWVIPGIFGIVGTLTGVFVANLFQRKKERRDAFIDFYKAFADTLYYLNTGDEFPFKIIPRMIVTHEIAKNVFHQYLRKRTIRSFDGAWDEYYTECKKYREPFQLKPEQWPQCREELLKKLVKLLAIAGQN